MVEGGMKCVKYLIFFFNFLFVISGIALATLGAVMKGYYNRYLDFLGGGVVGTPIPLIIVGVVIFFVAFLGCCGAIRESYCMTMTFAGLLALIFILELAAGIAAYVLRDDIRTTLNTNMPATLQNYGQDGYAGVTRTWDAVQMALDGAATIHTAGCLYKLQEEMKENMVAVGGAVGGAGVGVAFLQILGVILACCLSKGIKKEYETA
ncbi:CD63 antigen [Amphibalanus amphitrite]|uniref:CD63 antigen n=1 Tax=Amphibalanus amphitrite TaxID=1232801 RepID=A0A6A4W5T9_AMPAM|nr:CD63 antigen [Amphibalanus amphitrite]